MDDDAEVDVFDADGVDGGSGFEDEVDSNKKGGNVDQD